MRLFLLASDYDGTLATNGHVGESTLDALVRLKKAGCKLLLASGRQLDDLATVFDRMDMFDLLVLENGALLYDPKTEHSRLLCEPPPAAFAEALRKAGVNRLGTGQAIVATWRPHEDVVIKTIGEMGLDLQVIFNKDAVMVLPAGVTKASGLTAALEQLAISPHNTIGIGDAENDLAFLKMSQYGVAVANALPAVKDAADYVTARDHGGGVEELAERILSGEVERAANKLERHQIPLGSTTADEPVKLPPGQTNILFAGESGAGKSSIATGLVQRLAADGYQFCLIDPEGDYEVLGDAIVLGNAKEIPNFDEVMNVLHQPSQSVVVNLMGVKLDDRPAYLGKLMPRLQELLRESRRPHWVVIDEAHHVMPASRGADPLMLPSGDTSLIMITVNPERLDTRALRVVDRLVVVGKTAKGTIGQFCRVAQIAPPTLDQLNPPNDDEALLWIPGSEAQIIKPLLGKRESGRHRRKYATGELGADRSFYFRGPDRRLNLRAYNLETFVRLADGIDDDTWMFHLRRGDYSRWFSDSIKDEDLANAVRRTETNSRTDPGTSRAAIRKAIEERYTAHA